ncbi:hypothetical protein EJA70_31515 [Pseudomonas sp. PB103]|uniref:hypothetical protein n=1 Tax=Pseudomonas sp. PB103 TaxID=2494698 RepID=UPI00131B6CF9|nr:hypothetical protein [Pseudomonas sp. PB103]KAE9638343.1 hypothetical protein EJA70_31515 [Pseudomonas sp. PB103]
MSFSSVVKWGRRALLLLAAAVVALVAAACYVKTEAARLAHEYSTAWNDAGTCYIQSYIPQYSALGVAGSIAKMFTSEAFFRVYAKDGTLLKSSEWLLWQNEFTTDERSQWAGSHAIYPTVSGYEGWNIPVCG